MKSKNPYGGSMRGPSSSKTSTDDIPGPCTHGEPEPSARPKGFEAGSAYAPPRIPSQTPRLVYCVTATLADAGIKDEYLAWLTDGHIQAVLAGGALECSVEIMETLGEDTAVHIRSRYVFADQEAFNRYDTEVAPPLRAEGLERFGNRGVTYTRDKGTVFWRG